LEERPREEKHRRKIRGRETEGNKHVGRYREERCGRRDERI
jgi:hypothetical protein